MLLPWSGAVSGYVDPSGRRVEPQAGAGRAVTLVDGDGTPLAALVHDEALLEDPGLVSAIAATVRLTVDNDDCGASSRTGSTTSPRPGPGSSPLATRSDDASNATCTTAPSSGW